MTAPNHFLDIASIKPATLKRILAHAHGLKEIKFNPPQLLSGLSLAMIFDKRSTRTRVSFEVAMKQLGGHCVVMNAGDIQLSGAESLEDTARTLSRFVDGLMIRMSSHENLLEIAKHASIPVINGLSDLSHPCQIMADLMTIEEKKGSLNGLKLAWFGDYNNVARTFVEAAPVFGFDLVLSCPAQLAPADKTLWVEDPAQAAKGADVIISDTWASMGQEGKDLTAFWPYQVNEALMAHAKDNAIFMHCMPIHRGEEVTDAVLASKASVIYDEAENRLHAQKAVLAWALSNAGVTIRNPAP